MESRDIRTVVVAITLDTGELAVMRFITRGRGNDLPQGATWEREGYWQRPATAENIAAEVRKTFDGHAERPVSWRDVPETAIPIDRTYRGAWVDVAGAIAHDMTKARAIHRDRIRAARLRPFAELDAAYLRADEANDAAAKARIVAEKQALRDRPADPRIDAAQTIDELKRV